MNYNNLLYVIEVAKYENFSKAAEKLYISQPALSQSINRLEEKLGVVLFKRTKNSVEITEAGKLFVKQAEKIIKQMDNLEKIMIEYSEKDLQNITIGISQFYGKYFLPNVIKVLNNKYPDIQINIKESESRILEDYLLKGEIDLAIIPLPIKSKDIYYETLYTEELVFAVNSLEKHLITADVIDETVDLAHFKNASFVLLNSGFKLRITAEQICSEEFGFVPKVVFESENLDLLNSLISNNIGVSFLPSNISKFPNVKYLHIKSQYNIRDIVLASINHNTKKLKIKNLAKAIKESL